MSLNLPVCATENVQEMKKKNRTDSPYLAKSLFLQCSFILSYEDLSWLRDEANIFVRDVFSLVHIMVGVLLGKTLYCIGKKFCHLCKTIERSTRGSLSYSFFGTIHADMIQIQRPKFLIIFKYLQIHGLFKFVD